MTYGLLDANIFLEFRWEEIPWVEIVGEPCTLIVTWVTLHELDEQKGKHPLKTKRERARKALERIEKLTAPGATETLPGGVVVILEDLGPMPDLQALGLDQSIPDHRIVGLTKLARDRFQSDRVLLITDDTTPRIAARTLGLDCVDPPEASRQPDPRDDHEKQVASLKEQLFRATMRAPNVVVAFGNGETRFKWLVPTAQPIDESQLARQIQRARAQYPLRSSNPVLDGMGLTQQYNSILQDYFNDLDLYYREEHKTKEAQKRLVEASLIVSNDGSGPADNVQISLTFPPGIEPLRDCRRLQCLRGWSHGQTIRQTSGPAHPVFS